MKTNSLLRLLLLLPPFASAGLAHEAHYARLVNIATRAQVGGAAGSPIPGFVLSGAGAKPVLVRAAGPALTGFGVPGALANPRVELFGGSNRLAANEDWLAADGAAMTRVGAFAFSAGSRDAALISALPAGAFTAPILASDSGTGVALVEVYDTDPESGPAIINASTRGFVGTGDNVLIPGFVVGGAGTMRLLIRAVGPTLAGFGVTGALADPTVTLYRDGRAVWTNDNWSISDQATEIANVSAAVGAFALGAASKDAAMIVTVTPGAYSAVVSGVGGTTGTALVELYVVPAGVVAMKEGEWSARADLLEPNSEMSVAELDGKIYIFGGYPATRLSVATVQVYDSVTDTWSLGTPLPVALNHTVAVPFNGKIYVIGGQTGTGGNGPFVNTVYEYDPERKTWATRAPMPTSRGGGGAALIDGRIYVAGGRPPRGNDFAVYDPTANSWRTLPDLPSQRNHVGAVALGGKFYVMGGRLEAGFESPMTAVVEVYDPATNQWTTRAPMLRPRGGLNAIVAHGYIHTFGGEGTDDTPTGVFPDHDVYDPARNVWLKQAPMPMPVHGVTGCSFINGLIHLTGGGMMEGGASGGLMHQVFRPAMTYR